MKQCISRFIHWINHLWQTLKEYVCRKTKSSNINASIDIDHDGIPDVIFDINYQSPSQGPEKENNNEEVMENGKE